MADWSIRSYQNTDLSPVVRLWNQTLTRDPISERIFQVNVLSDENFDPRGTLVAQAGGEVIGFLLAIVRKVPLYGVGLQEKLGFITTFFVHPDWRRQGIGTALLERGLGYLREQGRSVCSVSPYVPYYFIPGVDTEVYAPAVSFLEKAGFAIDHKAYGMTRSLWDFAVGEECLEVEARLAEEGVHIQFFSPEYTHELLQFLDRCFPGDWPRVIRERIRCGADSDVIVIAVQGEKVLGYCQYDGEHFGPFGVDDVMRGKGVGTALILRCMERMREKGVRNLFLLWTGAVDFYSRKAGLSVFRESAIMKKNL